ncbi:MAG: enoyl-CoA hydratase/isomerase family protein [Polyangiaceae bacterium]|nr:enoyl-CoA hydratase/isomerase family protein [Polyangiaceae bacterium]
MDAHPIELPETLSAASLEALEQALVRAEADARARVWLVTGGDGTFCRGMDLAGYAAGGVSGAALGSLRQFGACIGRLRRAGRPTIALVDGAVQGGGVGLAAACDIVLCTPRSSFALPEALFGLLPGIVLPVLLERMTLQQARLLTLLGSARDAGFAVAHGLADEVVPAGELRRRAARLGRELGRVGTPRVRGLRAWLYEAVTLDPEAALACGAEVTAELLKDDDVRRGIQAFLADGTPPWEQEP